MNNADQVAFWNGPAGDKWAKYQDHIDRTLAHLGDAVLEFAAPQPGENVLDVGCGSGALTALFDAAVGEDGAVTGLDISAPMLAVARQRVPAARFIHADASDYGFGPVNDIVTSRLGVMFFENPVAAFANLRRALKHSGRLAVIVWRSAKENEWVRLPHEAALPHLPPQDSFDPSGPGQFSLADPDHIRAILGEAGWRDITVTPTDGKMELGDDMDEAVNYTTRLVGPTSRAMRDLDEAGRKNVMQAVRDALAPLAVDGKVRLGTAAWLVGAKP